MNGVQVDELEGLSRSELIERATSMGVERAEVLTRVELVDEIIRRTIPDPIERRVARGLLGVARDLVARVVERGLHLPDAAAKIRARPGFASQSSSRGPIATVTLAEIYAAQGHKTRALAVLDEVLAHEPDHLAARELRDRVAGAMGRDDVPATDSDSLEQATAREISALSTAGLEETTAAAMPDSGRATPATASRGAAESEITRSAEPDPAAEDERGGSSAAYAALSVETDAATSVESVETDAATSVESVETDAAPSVESVETDATPSVESVASAETDAATSVESVETDAAPSVESVEADAATSVASAETDVELHAARSSEPDTAQWYPVGLSAGESAVRDLALCELGSPTQSSIALEDVRGIVTHPSGCLPWSAEVTPAGESTLDGSEAPVIRSHRPGLRPAARFQPGRNEPDSLVVLDVQPGVAYLYWELSASSVSDVQSEMGPGELVLRLLVAEPSWGGPIVQVRERHVTETTGGFSVSMIPANAAVRAALGWKSGNGFQPLVVALDRLAVDSRVAAITVH